MYDYELNCKETAQEAFFDESKKEKLKKKIAILEFGQWWWVHQWEENIKNVDDLQPAIEAKPRFDQFSKFMQRGQKKWALFG